MAESSVRYLANLATLFKLNVGNTYGDDTNPTGLADAIQFSEVTVNPMAGGEVGRGLLKSFMGHQGVFLTGTYATLQGSVELTGSGEPGVAPAFGPLLRACGMHETVTAETDVTYNPISRSFEAGALYYNLDGVRHIMLGVRGTFTIGPLAPAQIPRITFNLSGLSGTITDAPLPEVDVTKFIDPVPVSAAVTTMELFGWDAIAESLSIDLGASIEPRFLIGEESIKYTGRQSTATAVVQATSLATVNWFNLAASHTKGELEFVHGNVAGNIVEIGAPGVQLGRITQGATQNIANYSLPLMLTAVAGNDDFTLAFR